MLFKIFWWIWLNDKLKKMSEIVGTNAIKAVVKILIDIGEGIQEKFADDKKLSIVEAILLAIKLFPDIYSVARRGQELKAEWQDFSDAEKQLVAEYVAAELDLTADEVEEKVEKGFELLMAVDSFLRSFKKDEVAK